MKHHHHFTLLDATRIAGVLAWLGSSGFAQSRVLQFEGTASTGGFGRSVASVGDVDGDGFGDIAVGDPRDASNGTRSGRVGVYSGATGSLLFAHLGDAESQLGTSVRGAGDVDADGRPDIVVGARMATTANGTETGLIRIYSGATGGLLHEIPGVDPFRGLGRAVDGVGDLDGDGFDDVVASQAGAVFAFSGRTGGVLRSWVSTFTFGERSIAAAGDVDGDGVNDVIVGAENEIAGTEFTGAAYVVSGRTGELLYRFFGDANADRFGHRVDGAGDVDADGHADLLVGAFRFGVPALVRVLSGRNGDVLYDIVGSDTDARAFVASGVGDVNQDGHDDFGIGAPRDDAAPGGLVRVYSGRDGTLLAELDDAGPLAGSFGSDLDGGVDITGDGIVDLVVSDPDWEVGGQEFGRVTVWAGACANVQRYCVSAPHSSGLSARIGSAGVASLADDGFALTVHEGPPGVPGLFLAGTSAIQVLFGDGFRCVGGQAARLGPFDFTDTSGTIRRELSLQSGPLSLLQPGDTRYFQFWFRDAGGPGGSGFNLTDGLSVTFCP